MFGFLPNLVLLTSYLTGTRGLAIPPTQPSKYSVRPFTIDLSARFSALKEKIASTSLPNNAAYLDNSGVSGIPLHDLKSYRDRWLHDYNWTAAETELNDFKHYKVEIEGIDLHFVHEKSSSSDAIPILFIHGWPGAFYEFTNVIKPLTQSTSIGSGKNVSFNVVIPSLPGFLFSSPAARANWTVQDTGRVFNTLMTEVLGYDQYALHSTDLGSGIGWPMYDSFNQTIRGAYFNFLPFFGPTLEQIAADNITLSEMGKFTIKRYLDFKTYFFGYFQIQTFQPNQIGFSLYDSPMAQFSWIDSLLPNGFAPGTPNVDNICLTFVSLYALTESFLSSIYIYAQNPTLFSPTYQKARTDAPMLFANNKYDVGYWPKEYAAKAGNLVYFKEHTKGGHFPAIDNPTGWMDDIRQLGKYYKPTAKAEPMFIQSDQEQLSMVDWS